jgi:predicted Co/Zn/Cd cation transporter (cation efflux family)
MTVLGDVRIPGEHTHTFGQDRKQPEEARTFIVIAITSAMTVVEISTGILFGSMALLADGMHMASHAAALGISAFAYVYARRRALDQRFSFGTGKVNALGGFTGAILLALFALMIAWESVGRMISPVEIAFRSIRRSQWPWPGCLSMASQYSPSDIRITTTPLKTTTMTTRMRRPLDTAILTNTTTI